MLGLQTSYDIKNVSRLTASSSQASSNKKSHKFTKQLINRFDVTGVSNSLEKHENYKVKMGEVDSDQPVKVVNKQSQFAHEDLTKRQNAEMQRDQERLAELEEKLQEIQRKKELRRARDRNRRKRRMEFMAAGKIQKCFRGFAHRKLVIAANIVTHFIKVVKNRNALTVGSWAATVIARFAKYATSVFQDGKEANEQAEKMRTLWEMAATKLKAETETRKAVAHSISMYSLRQGLVTVAKKRIVELRDISRKKKKDQKWRGRGKGGTKTSLRKSKLSPKSSESKENFFLTETSGDEGSTYSSDNSCSPISTANNTTSEMVENSRKNFVDVANIPMMPQINNDVGFSMEISEIGMDLMNFDDEPYDEEAELEKERLKELANTHAQREAEMQKERAARLAAIERKKKGKAREEAKRLKQETAEREARDNARYEWLDRQEDKRMEHASNLTKKRKAQEREIKRVQRELELMRKEDKEKKKPELMPKIKIKRPRTPTDYEMEMAYLKEQEEIEKKEAAAKKIYDQNKEATKKRLEARAEKDKKEKEFEEEKAKVKKDKQKKLANDAQEALARAMEIKKQQDKAAKQREKELAAIDADDKITYGRTHNSKGKKVLKGFIRDHDKPKDKKVSNNAAKITGISSNVAVRDPIVEEWNYNCQPSETELNQGLEVSSNASDFKFDDFIVSAKEHALNVDELTEDLWPFGEESNNDEKELDFSTAAGIGVGSIEDMLWDHRLNNNGEDGATKSDDDKLISARSQFVSDDKENSNVEDKTDVLSQKPVSHPMLAKRMNGKKKVLHDKNKNNAEGKKKKIDTAGPNVRDVRIPKALRETPYFKSYKSVKNVEKSAALVTAQAQVAKSDPIPAVESSRDTDIPSTDANLISPLNMVPPPFLGSGKYAQPKMTKKSIVKGSLAKPGKVATLMEMVARARKKVGSASHQAPVEQNVIYKKQTSFQRSTPSKRANEPKSMVPSPYFPPPPKLELSDIQAKENSEVGNMSGSLCDYYFASKGSTDAQYFEVSESDHFPSNVSSPDDVQAGESFKMEEENVEIAEEKRQEAALNAECDELRMRLESRIKATSVRSKSMESVKPSASVDSLSVPTEKKEVSVANESLPTRSNPYSINMDLPDFSMNLLDAWQKEDEGDNDHDT